MAKNKKIPEINASSQADIAFTVLIFFLVVSTMDVDTGIVRVLPPMPDPNVKQEDVKVKERNLFLVFVSGSGQIMAGGKVIPLHQLKDKAKEFILNPMDNKNLPEKVEKELEMPDGSKWVSFLLRGTGSALDRFHRHSRRQTGSFHPRQRR